MRDEDAETQPLVDEDNASDTQDRPVSGSATVHAQTSATIIPSIDTERLHALKEERQKLQEEERKLQEELQKLQEEERKLQEKLKENENERKLADANLKNNENQWKLADANFKKTKLMCTARLGAEAAQAEAEAAQADAKAARLQAALKEVVGWE